MERSSNYLIAAQTVTAASGFVFWLLAARLFAPRAVGVAAGVVSLGGLVAVVCALGLPTMILRYGSEEGSVFGLASTSAIYVLFAGAVGVALSEYIVIDHSSRLRVFGGSVAGVALLSSLVIGAALVSLLDSALVASGAARSVLWRTLITLAPRCAGPVILRGGGAEALVGAFGASMIIGAVTDAVLLLRVREDRIQFRFGVLRRRRAFIASNSLGGALAILPGALTPVVVLEVLGPRAAAYFYIPIQLIGVLQVIPASVSQAVMGVGRQGGLQGQILEVRRACRHVARVTALVTIAAALCIWPVLRLYGSAYARVGAPVALLFVVSAWPICANWMGDTWLNLRQRPGWYLAMNALNALLVTSACAAAAPGGLLLIGGVWCVAQSVTAIVYAVSFGREIWAS